MTETISELGYITDFAQLAEPFPTQRTTSPDTIDVQSTTTPLPDNQKYLESVVTQTEAEPLATVEEVEQYLKGDTRSETDRRRKRPVGSFSDEDYDRAEAAPRVARISKAIGKGAAANVLVVQEARPHALRVPLHMLNVIAPRTLTNIGLAEWGETHDVEGAIDPANQAMVEKIVERLGGDLKKYPPETSTHSSTSENPSTSVSADLLPQAAIKRSFTDYPVPEGYVTVARTEVSPVVKYNNDGQQLLHEPRVHTELWMTSAHARLRDAYYTQDKPKSSKVVAEQMEAQDGVTKTN